MKTISAIIAGAFALAACAASTSAIATRKYVDQAIANAMAGHTGGQGYVYTATAVTNAAAGTVAYTSAFQSEEIPEATSITFVFATCTNAAVRLTGSTIPGLGATTYYARTADGTAFRNAQDGVFGRIYTHEATNTAGQAFQTFTARTADGTRYAYRLNLGVGTLYAETNEAWRATLSTTTIGDRKAAKLLGR